MAKLKAYNGHYCESEFENADYEITSHKNNIYQVATENNIFMAAEKPAGYETGYNGKH